MNTTINYNELPQHNGSMIAAAWTTWYEYSDRACHDTAKVYRWYVSAFFSEAANARYEWVGQIIGCALALVYFYAKRWVDAEVAAALPAAKPVALLMPAAEPEPEVEDADPFSPESNPHFEAAVNAFDAFIEKATASPTAKEPTLQDLRKECIERNKGLAKGDPRRIKRAGHLTKQEALAALGRI